MISYYQPHLIPFLTTNPARLSPHLNRHYYLSWEDALWDILPQLNIKTGSTILIPNFYCLDVIKNIRLHGYRVKLYPLDDNFQISLSAFNQVFREVKPNAVIIFHASGLTNKLANNNHFINRLATHSLIIEDYVHRIIDVSAIKLIHDQHLIIDSLRKNTPLPGSFVYMSSSTARKISKSRIQSPVYVIKVHIYFFIYRLILSLGALFHNQALIKYAHHGVLDSHDDLVGDSLRGNPGLFGIPFLHKYLNLSKIRTLKRRQVKIYLDLLLSLKRTTYPINMPTISKADEGELHAFPLVIKLPLAKVVEKALYPLNVWTKFSDSAWSKSKRVFFLPLGFHITPRDQKLIAQTILNACQK